MPVGGLSLESMLAMVQAQAGERRRQQAAQETRPAEQSQGPSGQQPCGPSSSPAASADATGDAGARWNGFNPGPDRSTPPVEPATAGQEAGANLYQPQAEATAATATAAAPETAAAPTAMERFRQANPALKTNQDAINHFYKAGGGSWEGASRAARDAGLNLSTFVRDRRGALPGGGSTTPTSPTQPTSPTSPTTPTTPTEPTTPTTPGPTSPSASGTARSIKGFREVDVEKLRAQLPSQAKHLAEAFVESGRKHNVDPLTLAAIAKHETGNFTSSAFRNKNNAMGISNARGPTMQPSHEASIDKMAKLLGSTTGGPYKNASTIGEVANIYAPIGAGNDPTGLNNHWARGVSRFADDFERTVRGGDAVS